MNDEQYLRGRIGTKNPFRVPEGYFEGFTDQLMERLPERQPSPVAKPALLYRLHPWLYAAVFLLVAVMSVTLYMHHADNQEQQLAQDATSADSYFEEATDYAMLDNYDIYACLASE